MTHNQCKSLKKHMGKLSLDFFLLLLLWGGACLLNNGRHWQKSDKELRYCWRWKAYSNLLNPHLQAFPQENVFQMWYRELAGWQRSQISDSCVRFYSLRVHLSQQVDMLHWFITVKLRSINPFIICWSSVRHNWCFICSYQWSHWVINENAQ